MEGQLMIKNITNRQKYLYKTVFWASLAGLLILSSIPELPSQATGPSGDSDFRYDYLFHFLAYAAITVLYIQAYRPRLHGFLLLAIYAALEEAHQFWIPGRTLNPVDFGFDLAGLLLIGLLWLAWHRFNVNTSEK